MEATKITSVESAEAGSLRDVKAKCTGDVTVKCEYMVNNIALMLISFSERVGLSSITFAITK